MFLIPSINNIYLRYTDDILLLTNSSDEMNIIEETFQNNSVFNFTQEININNKTWFFRILIDTSNVDRFTISTYKKKPIDINLCTLNIHTECPLRYKRIIIKKKTLTSRDKRLSSSWTIFLNELKNIR